MDRKQKFFLCESCGNMVGVIDDGGVPLVCCGDDMTELVPNSVEASGEKHLPDVSVSGDTVNVQVGSVAHPMEDDHYISFIYLETECGGQRKALNPGNAPKASFALFDDKAIAVYAYCNLHGLWVTEI